MASPKVNRVFAGNLPFNTTDEELAELFSGSSKRKVESANVVRHGTHSLGFGFVVFTSAEDAEAAIKELDKKEFKTRIINVEIAKGEPRKSKPKKRRPAGTSGRKSGETSSPAGAGSKKKSSPSSSTTGTKKRAPPKKRTPKPRPASDEEEGSAEDKEDKRSKPKPRAKKTRRPPAPKGPPSTTTIFVANLPYAVDDEKFKALFKDLGLVEGHIARTKKGKSKGFGFASFKDEAAQLKAIEAVNAMEVDERKLSANRSTSKRAEGGDEGAASTADDKKTAPAAATTSTAAAPAPATATTASPAKDKNVGGVSSPAATKKAAAPAASPAPEDKTPKDKPKEQTS